MEIINSPSPNFSESTLPKTTLVIHKTLGLMPGTLEWLRSQHSQVSSQYLITKKGEIHQLVQNGDMAWHSGRIYNPSNRAKKVMLKTSWGSYINPNKYCIGIENEALINNEPTKEQLEANIWLFKTLKDDPSVNFNGNPDHFITHKDITSYKPDMELWRNKILSGIDTASDDCKLVLDNWNQLKIEVVDGKIVLSRRLSF